MKTLLFALALLASLHTDRACATNIRQNDYAFVNNYGTCSLAIALINAPADEQELMLYDLYIADPRLAIEVLDVAEELFKVEVNSKDWMSKEPYPSEYPEPVDGDAIGIPEDGIGWASSDFMEHEYNINGWHIENFSTNERGADVTQDTYLYPVDDGTFSETFRKALKVRNFTVNACDVDHPDTLQWEGTIGGARPNGAIAGPQTYDRSGSATSTWIPTINSKSDAVSIDRLKQQYDVPHTRTTNPNTSSWTDPAVYRKGF